MKILIATTNQGKIREISDILSGSDISLVTPKDLNLKLDVDEDGQTFIDNATKKAVAWCKAAGMPALADDSGLCVDALDGQPGVMSARFAGEHATDQANYELLLDKMKGITNRKARFVCAAAVAFPDGKFIVATGECEGLILDKPSGSGGFGYDPVFYDSQTKKTFAEFKPSEKNEQSHRRRALIALKQQLNGLIT